MSEIELQQELQEIKKQLAFLTNYVTSRVKRPDSEMLLGDYLRMWFNKFRVGKKAPATVQKDYWNLEYHIIPELGGIRLCDLDTYVLQDFFDSVTKSRQREHYAVLLKNALSRAVELKELSENPMHGVVIPKHTGQERLGFTAEIEHDFFRKAMYPEYAEYYDSFVILRYAGIRPGELYALAGTDFIPGGVSITRAMDTLGNVKEPKTAAGVRVIPIVPEMAYIEKKYKGKSDLIVKFPGRKLEDCFRDICTSLGLGREYVLYSLRHTFITRCAERGVHPKITQKWAGHATLEMTLKYYTHISDEWEKTNIDKLITK